MEGFYFILFVVAVLAIYFLPTIIAAASNHVNLVAVFVFNLFLGWTFLGWVVALVWACLATQKRPANY